MHNKDLLAYCGLYCGACSFKVAYDENDRQHLTNLPSKYDQYKAGDLQFCPGCKLDNQCGECAIRNCARDNKLSHCGDCKAFPCDRLVAFNGDGIPHHSVAISNLKTINKIGEDSWLSQQEKKWTSIDGKKISWYFGGYEMQSNSWKWNDVKEKIWEEPAAEILDPIFQRWIKDKRKTMLDLGAGIGRHSIYAAKLGFYVHALDSSKDGIQKLQDHATKESLSVEAVVADMHELPFKDHLFDAILSFHTIYHTNKTGLEKIIKEIERVLKPDGEVFLTFNPIENKSLKDPTNKVIDERTIIKTEGVEAGILHYYVDEPEIKRLLKNFHILRLERIDDILVKDYVSWHYFVLAEKK